MPTGGIPQVSVLRRFEEYLRAIYVMDPRENFVYPLLRGIGGDEVAALDLFFQEWDKFLERDW